MAATALDASWTYPWSLSAHEFRIWKRLVSGHVRGKGEDILTTTVNIDGFIDQRKVGRYQVQVLVLCVLMLMLDGFDDRSIAFVVPTLATDWGVANSAFGLVFSAGLLGAAIGALEIGRAHV